MEIGEEPAGALCCRIGRAKVDSLLLVDADTSEAAVVRGVCGTKERKAFSYNKRTMDRAMGPFSPLWHFLESITYLLST